MRVLLVAIGRHIKFLKEIDYEELCCFSDGIHAGDCRIAGGVFPDAESAPLMPKTRTLAEQIRKAGRMLTEQK